MKSIQELRVDSNKQQLLESRINSQAYDLNGINETEPLNSMENSKIEDNSSSSNCIVNNSIVNSVADTSQSNANTNTVVSTSTKHILSTQNDPYSSPNRQQIIVNKRKRRPKNDSPCVNKKYRSDKISLTGKRIDEMFKSLQSIDSPNQISPAIKTTLTPIKVPEIVTTNNPVKNSPHPNSWSDNSIESNCQENQTANNPNSLNNNQIVNSTPTLLSNQAQNPQQTDLEQTANIVSNMGNNVVTTSSTSNPTITGSTAACNISQSNITNNCLSQSTHIANNDDIANNTNISSSNNLISTNADNLIIELRRKIDDLEQGLSDKTVELEKNRETIKQCREALTKSLIAQTELERREAREKNARLCIELGTFRPARQGAHVDDKWIQGQNYLALDQRREQMEAERECFEKEKKQFNRNLRKNKVGNDASTQENIIDLQLQADVFEIRKNNLNKREKELQEMNDKLDRERVLHIRETKRIAHEDSSRFRKYPILKDRYLMLSLLGRGGFSEVFRAYDLDNFVWVACKVHELNLQWAQEKKDSYVRHALREIEIHKQLCHPRIVRVHDVFNIDSDAFCTVQEFCPGNDLDFFLKQQTPRNWIPEKEARCIISQVVSALRYLNERRNPIIHYDLKPGNILLCRKDCGSCEIKLTDFGLSKIFPDNNGLTDPDDGMELTSQGAGTYWYLPPECFVTEKLPTISSKVDVWSVGVVFYQCLYGKKPFGDNETQTDILHNNTILQARSINFPSNPKVSDSAKDFIRKCCTYRKELRPDVFQLYNDDYLKPKSQPKYGVDVSILPGPGIANTTNNSITNNSNSAAT